MGTITMADRDAGDLTAPSAARPRCPRCDGRLFVEEELGGAEYCCLYCGFRREIEGRPGAGRRRT